LNQFAPMIPLAEVIDLWVSTQKKPKKAFNKFFPGAAKGKKVEQMVFTELDKMGFTNDNTLYADCSCPDEINHNDPLEDITSLF